MRVALYGGHNGEIRMMNDLLEDHEVTYYDNSYFAENITEPEGADIAISLFPYRDMEVHTGKTPLIIYATNPLMNNQQKVFEKIKDKRFVTIVKDVDNCYSSVFYPFESSVQISHAIKPDRLPPYIGNKKMVAVSNRQPFSRWNKLMIGSKKKSIEITGFLSGIPFAFLHIPDEKEFYKELAKYRAVFYFSDNPYTLFMYEAMTMGIPMVGYFHSCVPEPPPMKKYFKHYSKDEEEISTMLRSLLDSEPKKVEYPIVPFSEAKRQWNEVINTTVKNYA